MRVFFTGTYEHTIDDKKRLSIPSHIRKQVSESSAGNLLDQQFLYATLGHKKTLCLYTELEFNRLAEALDQSPADQTDVLDFEELFFSLARRVEIDKQGRVLLPDHLIQLSGISTDVVLLGVKDHLEVRDKKAWMAHLAKTLDERPELLVNPRRAAKQINQTGEKN